MADTPGRLGKHLFSFAVISDTHVNPDEDVCNSPFPVNGRANRRFRHVVADINQRDVKFVVHLGDLVHPVPDTGALYEQAADAYRAIEADLQAPVWHVPGNHDIGDTPVKGAPASPTTKATIAAWVNQFGSQWQAFSHDGMRFILLNAQLINSGLADEVRQQNWVEAELEKENGRVMLMFHHPAYLCVPDEPNHYDNTDLPGRKWLLKLLERKGVEAAFSGHAHNFWYDRYSETDYYLAPATSFVRQDYSDMQRVKPPEGSEAGRDDRAKLGYLLVQVYRNGNSVQIVRTFGAELAVGVSPAKAQKVGPTPKENSNPLIGFDLRQHWAEISEVAPSGGLDEFDRKLVRNDYPLLALIEMGVRNVRIPLADLRDPYRRRRLRTLRHLGFRITLFGFGIPNEPDLKLIVECRNVLTDWEATIDWSDLGQLTSELAEAHTRTGLPIYISRMRSKLDTATGSLFYHVINHGFDYTDEKRLDSLARMRTLGVVGAVFRLGNSLDVETTLAKIDKVVAERNLLASVHFRVAGDNPAIVHDAHETTCRRVAEAINLAPTLAHTRIFCDTLADNDRGYFPRQGAIDRNGNPNPLLEVIRNGHLR